MATMLATGVGSMPGEDATAYAQAVRVVVEALGEEPGMPFLPELPGRGAGASITGRGAAVLADLDLDLQPAGWRLTGTSGAPGIDQRRARSLLAQDLDAFEEALQGYTGTAKIQIAGPWTLAATLERPRGDKALADHGLRRDLAQALAAGVGEHVADVRRRLPDASRLVVQLDEPALAAVGAARVPTASGFGRHRSVDKPELSESLSWVLDAVVAAGGEPWVHSCAAETPWALIRGAGARGLVVDADLMRAEDLDVAAEALDAGETVALGVVPSLDPASPPSAGQITERILRLLDMLGLDPDAVGDRVVVASSCGLAGASGSWARTALTLTRDAARDLTG